MPTTTDDDEVRPAADPPLAAKAEPTPSPAPEIAYAPTTSISRRQFRFLLTLTLLNTLILAGFVVGPGVSRITSGWWQDYQKWQADWKAAAKKQADLQRATADFQDCLAHAAPADQVVYDEDPARAAELPASEFDRVYVSGYQFLTPQPWQPPVARRTPATLAKYVPRTAVFVHARKPAHGPERLVVVDLRAQASMSGGNGRGFNTDTRAYTIGNQRALSSCAYSLMPDGSLSAAPTGKLSVLQEAAGQTLTWTMGDSWENGRVEARARDVLRLFAGQADPADASHFTVAYELDGAPGVIDGWLNDNGTTLLQPRAGRIVRQDITGQDRIWDPYARPATAPAAAPATRPRTP